MTKTPVLLIILDGFGVNPSRAHIAWALAKTPHLDHYFVTWPHTVLQASGEAVAALQTWRRPYLNYLACLSRQL